MPAEQPSLSSSLRTCECARLCTTCQFSTQRPACLSSLHRGDVTLVPGRMHEQPLRTRSSGTVSCGDQIT